jgi:hypothetical protein
VNNNEIHPICVGKRQQNTLKTIEQNSKGKRGRESRAGFRLIEA